LRPGAHEKGDLLGHAGLDQSPAEVSAGRSGAENKHAHRHFPVPQTLGLHSRVGRCLWRRTHFILHMVLSAGQGKFLRATALLVRGKSLIDLQHRRAGWRRATDRAVQQALIAQAMPRLLAEGFLALQWSRA
jgi:hypothetical protein